MTANFGVVVERKAAAARPFTIDTTTIIGIVGYEEGLSNGLIYYPSLKKAIAASSSSILKILKELELFNINSQIVVSRSATSDSKDIVEAAKEFRKASAQFTVKPNIIIAPDYSHVKEVGSSLIAVADSLKAIAIIDCYKPDQDTQDGIVAAKKYAELMTGERVLRCFPFVKVDSSLENRPYSTFIAGQIALTDSSSEYGFAESFSNRSLPILGLSYPIEYVPGEDCEADQLRNAKIVTVIPYKGFRSWGGETSTSDPIWSSISRVRVFDKIMETVLDQIFWCIDRKADQLKFAKDSLEKFMLDLKGSNVLLGYDVYWDEERNTKTNITNGKFYLVVEMQDVPIVKRLEITFSYVDRYSDVLIKSI